MSTAFPPDERESLRVPDGPAILPDSGERRSFSTGAVRDAGTGKGMPHLIPPIVMRRLAQRYEDGATKYAARNWEQGIPLSSYVDSALRHIWSMLEGKTDEDHAGAALWNIGGFIATEQAIKEGRLPDELNDLSDALWFGPGQSIIDSLTERL